MPRRSVILTSFLTLAVVVAITLKIWSLKLQVPLAVRTAQLTTEHIIDAREELSSDNNAEHLRRVNTQSLSNIPPVNDSESQLTVTVSRIINFSFLFTWHYNFLYCVMVHPALPEIKFCCFGHFDDIRNFVTRGMLNMQLYRRGGGLVM